MNQMRAMRVRSFGDSHVLKMETLPVPEVGENEILVGIRAASVNPVDYKTRLGRFPPIGQDRLPIILGRDISGTVVRRGRSVTAFREGDDVFALLDADHGGYCEFVAVRHDICAPKPERLSHVEAAAVPLAALTAWQGLFDHGKLQAGQSILVHGGGGGVGHFALQFARSRGARVSTTVSGPDLEFARTLGAEAVIDYKNERFEDRLSDVDLVFDLIGGETQARSLDVLKRGGALISALGIQVDELARKRGIRAENFMTRPSASELSEIGLLIEEGQVIPRVQTTYPLDLAADAQDYLENEHVQGKVVLKIAA